MPPDPCWRVQEHPKKFRTMRRCVRVINCSPIMTGLLVGTSAGQIQKVFPTPTTNVLASEAVAATEAQSQGPFCTWSEQETNLPSVLPCLCPWSLESHSVRNSTACCRKCHAGTHCVLRRALDFTNSYGWTFESKQGASGISICQKNMLIICQVLQHPISMAACMRICSAQLASSGCHSPLGLGRAPVEM